MAIELVVPKLGESITEAVVAKWLKQVGDAVGLDEPVADLETDKVSVALPAPAAGVLAEQRVPVGATVKVGEVIGVVTPGEKAAAAPAPAPAAAAPSRHDGEPAASAARNGPGVPQPSHPSPTVRKALRE